MANFDNLKFRFVQRFSQNCMTFFCEQKWRYSNLLTLFCFESQIFKIYVQNKESNTDLEHHEGVYLIKEFAFLGELYFEIYFFAEKYTTLHK